MDVRKNAASLQAKYRRYEKRVLTLPELSSLPPSMPLIIPNDREYDVSTNELRPIPGKKRSKLKIVPETLRLLASITRPVAVVAICGPCRTGKSYVLSRMLDSADAFELGHTMDAKTFGIWIGTTVLDCDEFTLLLVDTEGIDAVSSTMKDDAGVLVMTVLLSSCLIYNSFSVPKHSDLEKMSFFTQLAKSIAVNLKEPSRTGGSDERVKLADHFPDFLWLLRDVTLKPTGANGEEITPSEYLKTKVLRRSTSSEESRSNQVGEAILTLFPDVECKTIGPPSADADVMQNIAARQESLTPRFNEQVQELVVYLRQKVRGKKGMMSDKIADGRILASMATNYLEAVNDPDAIPCIGDAWQAAIEKRSKEVLDKLLLEYEEELQAKITQVGLPMEEDSPDGSDLDKPRTLLALHRSILLEKSKALLKQVGHFVPTSGSGISKKSLITELELGAATFTGESIEQELEGEQVTITRKKVTGGILFKQVQENHKASRSSCTQLFDMLYSPVEEKVMQADHSYSFDELQRDIDELWTRYYREAVGPAKWEVGKEKRAFIKAQESSYKQRQVLKKEVCEARQETAAARAEARAEAAELDDKITALKTQMKSDAEMNETRMEDLKRHHEEEIARQKDAAANAEARAEARAEAAELEKKIAALETQMKSDAEMNETRMENLKRHHEEEIARQEAAAARAEARAEAAELNEKMAALATQMKSDAEMNERRMENLKWHHEEEITRLREEQSRKLETELRRIDDLKKADMEEQAKMVKRHYEQERERDEKVMEERRKENERLRKGIEEFRRPGLLKRWWNRVFSKKKKK